MPANARLRSSGFVAWDFFGGRGGVSFGLAPCPKDSFDRNLSNKQRPKKRDDRQGKKSSRSWWKSRQPVCMPRRISKEQNKSQNKKRICAPGLQILVDISPHASSQALQNASIKDVAWQEPPTPNEVTKKIDRTTLQMHPGPKEREEERKRKTAIIPGSKKSNASRTDPADHKRVHWSRLRCRERSGRKDLGYSGPASRSRWPDPKPVGRRSAPRPPAACCRCWRNMRTTS